MQRAQGDIPAHGMSEDQERLRQAPFERRQHGLEIGQILREISHMALERIGQRPARRTLPAPIHRDDGKFARAKLADCLEIFLDIFGAAGKDEHRAAPARAPLGGPDPDRRLGIDEHRLSARGNRIVRGRKELRVFDVPQ